MDISHARISPRDAFRSGSLFGTDWNHTRWIQFLEVSDGTTEGLRRLYPEVPNLGESYDPPDDFQDNDDISHDHYDDDDQQDPPDAPSRPPSSTSSAPETTPYPSTQGSDNRDSTITLDEEQELDDMTIVHGNRNVKRERPDYSYDEELDRAHGWRCLSPESSSDEDIDNSAHDNIDSCLLYTSDAADE